MRWRSAAFRVFCNGDRAYSSSAIAPNRVQRRAIIDTIPMALMMKLLVLE